MHIKSSLDELKNHEPTELTDAFNFYEAMDYLEDNVKKANLVFKTNRTQALDFLCYCSSPRKIRNITKYAKKPDLNFHPSCGMFKVAKTIFHMIEDREIKGKVLSKADLSSINIDRISDHGNIVKFVISVLQNASVVVFEKTRNLNEFPPESVV